MTTQGDTKASVSRLAMSVARAREWLSQRRAGVRPWATFVDQRRFARPGDFGVWCRRLVANFEHFQSNYVFIFLGLLVYCVLTSPLLLLALAVLLASCYLISLRAAGQHLTVFGRELTVAQQYGAAAATSFPLFWLAGAGSAVFWVLGMTSRTFGFALNTSMCRDFILAEGVISAFRSHRVRNWSSCFLARD
uniref:PRA1 family protein n=1 Tax=Eptatretus burgeri TaxID=7764 RepID=A0A8C4N8S8_EPTBU